MGKTIGFIGLGAIGEGMARNLVRAGHRVSGLDVRAAPLERHVEAGGLRAETPAEAASEADILCVTVYDSSQAREVLFGEAGALTTLPAGAVVAMHTTMPPDDSREIAARVEAGGHLFVDAPVTGGVDGADAGTLTVMAAGSGAALSAAHDALQAMSTKIVHCGEAAGDGSTVKMINQLLVGTQVALVAEAMTLAAKAGADPRTVFDVVSTGSARSYVLETWAPRILARDFDPHAMLDIFRKDLKIVVDGASDARAYTPLAAAALQMFQAGTAAGLGGEGSAALAKVYERMAGLEVDG